MSESSRTVIPVSFGGSRRPPRPPGLKERVELLEHEIEGITEWSQGAGDLLQKIETHMATKDDISEAKKGLATEENVNNRFSDFKWFIGLIVGLPLSLIAIAIGSGLALLRWWGGQ